jgi:hypothetical protein
MKLASGLLGLILVALIAAVLVCAAAAVLAWLLMAFIAVPSFWGAFWLFLAALIFFSGRVGAGKR